MSNERNHRCRIVLTGGPGGGKTTAADLFRREIGERVVIVPESATTLFQGGFPRTDEPLARRAVQTAIFHVQRNLEDIQSALYPGRVLLCDRGTLDGAAYWPDSPDDFFGSLGTTQAAELGSQHPHFVMVPNTPSFFRKITYGFAALERIVAEWAERAPASG